MASLTYKGTKTTTTSVTYKQTKTSNDITNIIKGKKQATTSLTL